MAPNPNSQALIDQAIDHLIREQQNLLTRSDSTEMVKIVKDLNGLLNATRQVAWGGIHKVKTVDGLVRQARRVEALADDLSETLWTPIQVAVSAIYERIEESLEPEEGRSGIVASVRCHFHNLRLRLLEQTLGARMLASSSDLGDEVERIVHQFLQRQLGDSFRVLRGGRICDEKGCQSGQIDIIVVPSETEVIVPGDSEDGKAIVFIDQVVSAIMVTSSLSATKLMRDWDALQQIPHFPAAAKDYPALSNHPWPLCYVLGAASDPLERLEEVWIQMCRDGKTAQIPQFVVALDSGFLYSGSRRWPCPGSPGNYTAPEQVLSVDGVRAGLGLAWLITQHRGRLAIMRSRATGPVERFAKLLDQAGCSSALTPTWSPRFNTSFQVRDIVGIMGWGHVATFAHNRLQLRTLRRGNDPVLLDGADRASWKFPRTDGFRWFRYGEAETNGLLIALEEWIDPKDKVRHRMRIAVFDSSTGGEISDPRIDRMKNVHDVATLSGLEDAQKTPSPFA